MDNFPLPEAALRDHIADLGKTGSGKTSTAKVIVEHVVGTQFSNMPGGSRVCILDPIKSDWWGITSARDGKHPGLPFYILGGPHGHVPLHSSTGAAMADLVASGELPLSIMDMADFEAGGLQRFFNDFAPRLLQKMRGVLYLVLEEAHEFAPKERSGIGNENLSVHWAKKLATAGRSRGLRMIVCTQRTQALHNALLGSCETMIAHRLTAPADQKPVVDWFKGNASRDVAKLVTDQISNLKTGTAWVYSGEAGISEKIHFPRIATFDNSATPDSDSAGSRVKTAPVDLDRLRALVGAAAAEVAANDTKALQTRIKELEKEVEALLALDGRPESPELSSMDLLAQVSAAEQRGYERGGMDGYADAVKEFKDCIEPLRDAMGDIMSGHNNIEEFVKRLAGWVEHAGKKAPQNITEIIPAPAPRAERFYRAPAGTAGIAVANAKEAAQYAKTGLTKSQTTILAALEWWRVLGHSQPTRVQVAVKAGMKHSGGGFRARLSELAGKGLLTYPNIKTLALTGQGQIMAPIAVIGDTVVATIRPLLTPTQTKIFDAMLAGNTSRARIAAACDPPFEPSGGGFRARLSELSSFGILEYPDKTSARLADWVRG